MSISKADSMKRLRAARKASGMREFRCWVDPIRFSYLIKSLGEPLCRHCGREEAECSADPCAAAKLEWD